MAKDARPRRKLPRLRTRPAGLLWVVLQRLATPEQRMGRFVSLLDDSDMDNGTKLARMRVLVDLGICEPSATQRNQAGPYYLGACVARRLERLTPGELYLALEAGIDPDFQSSSLSDKTFLEVCIQKGMLTHAKLLLAAGANPMAYENCAIHAALDNLDRPGFPHEKATGILSLLKQWGWEVNHPGSPNPWKVGQQTPAFVPIFRSIARKRSRAVEWLLDNGANPDVRGPGAQTILHAAVENFNPRVYGLVVDKCMHKLDALDEKGVPVLRYALGPAMADHLDVATDLVSRGASVDIVPTLLRPGDKVPSAFVLLARCTPPTPEAIDLFQQMVRRHPVHGQTSTLGEEEVALIQEVSPQWAAAIESLVLQKTTTLSSSTTRLRRRI